MKHATSTVFWLALASTASGQIPDLGPAIQIKLDRPDQQLQAVLELFRGSRSTDPASSLASWKRASAEPGRLGKPLEALIASINPAMVAELRTLDTASSLVWFEPGTGQPTWAVIIPRDDGTFSALATTMVLSGGAAEAPIEAQAVDRLGGPGSPLIMKTPTALILASSREGLVRAKAWPIRGDRNRSGGSGKILAELDRAALEQSTSLLLRRVSEALKPSKSPILVEIPCLTRHFTALATIPGPLSAFESSVEPSWFDWVPRTRAMLAFGFGFEPVAGYWDALFRLVDRVDRVDPSHANIASMRVRLDLLARLVGLRSEVDVLPHLRGISGWVGADGDRVDGALVAFHLDDALQADRIIARIRVPGKNLADLPVVEPGQARSLGLVEGRALRIIRWDRAVVLAWGEGVLEASSQSRLDPSRSAGEELRSRWDLPSKRPFAGGVWPGRIPGFAPARSPLAQALAESSPIRWRGEWVRSGVQPEPGSTLALTLAIDWDQLDRTTRRFLDLIPLDPPPTR